MNELEQRMLAQEAMRRWAKAPKQAAPPPWLARVRARKFDKQQAFSDDASKRKAALCTRRAGKTTGCASDLLEACGQFPGTEQLYLTLTRERAKDLMWGALKLIIAEEAIEATPNEVELRMTFRNGSSIKLAGADKAKEIEKRRGSKYKRVRIDESQSFGAYLKNLIEDVVEPATMDEDGDIGLLGTPGVVCAGYFHDVTTGKVEGWNVHRWSVLDNPFMPHARAWLEKTKRERGWGDDNPTYRREWLGEWVNDTGALFYCFDEARNTYAPGEVVPWGPGWVHVLGWDLGKTDAMALHWWGYHPSHPGLYEVCSWKKSEVSSDDVIHQARRIEEQLGLNVAHRVADTGGLGALVVEEVGNRTGMLFEPAKKTEKAAHVELFNDDMRTGRVKLLRSSATALEMAVLPKDADWVPSEHDGKPAPEDSRFDNHLCDAALYGWRRAYHYLHQPKHQRPAPGSKEALELEERAMEAAVIARQEQATEQDWWEREFQEDT